MDQDPCAALNRGQKNQTSSGSGNFQRSLQPSKYEIHKVLGICRLVFWGIGLFLFPSVLYTFFIDYHGKRVQVDKNLGESILVVLMVVDFVNIIFYTVLERLDDLRIGAQMLHICWLVICMLPLSLVTRILIISTNTRTFWHGVIPLLLQALPRGIQLSRLCAKAIPPSPNYGRWVLMFFYSFMLLGQDLTESLVSNFLCQILSKRHLYCYKNYKVIGAIWYGGAIYKVVECWEKSNDFCLGNTTDYDFGVFHDVHQSGILEMRGSVLKILYCFGWAIQKISGLGSNIDGVGTSVLENLFVILICFMSLLLVYFHFGQIQVYLQSNTKISMDTEEHLREIKQFPLFKKLSEDLQAEVMEQKSKQSVTGETKGVNIVNMFDGLSEDLKEKITKQLCSKLVKRVKEFQSWDDGSLDNLYASLKPDFFSEQTCIISENFPIKKLVFVVQGKLLTYTCCSNEDSIDVSLNTVLDKQRNDLCNKGDLCGEELVRWFQTNPFTVKLPASKRSIDADTNIEAFVLKATDLRNIFINCREAQNRAQGASTSNTVPANHGVNIGDIVPADTEPTEHQQFLFGIQISR